MIYEIGDKVFWLNSEGFQEGCVIRVLYSAEGSGETTKVYCKSEQMTELYQGDTPIFIFNSLEEMLTFYQKKLKAKNGTLCARHRSGDNPDDDAGYVQTRKRTVQKQ